MMFLGGGIYNDVLHAHTSFLFYERITLRWILRSVVRWKMGGTG